MGAVSIAFDTIIAGTLALPWVLLIVYLFFPSGKEQVGKFREWAQPVNQSAVAGVVLFAMAFTLGSAVSRIGQDFFNDDDLNSPVAGHKLRVGVTEDRIRASVYCGELFDEQTLRPEPANTYLKSKVHDFRLYGYPSCWQVLRWSVPLIGGQKDDDLIATVGDIFNFQEGALLLLGEDSTLRLRQFHDQIMVLRGAAFNGVVVLSLCCFAWGATPRGKRPASRLLLVLMSLPGVYLVAFAIAVVNHLSERAISDPPYMEFILLLLGGTGAWLLWSHPGRYLVAAALATAVTGAIHHFECLNVSPYCMAQTTFVLMEVASLVITGLAAWFLWNYEPEREVQGADLIPVQESPVTQREHRYRLPWAALVLLSLLVTFGASLGWWSSEVLYTQQVIYSYKALTDSPVKPSPK
jgi:hypothetical protein